MKYIEIECYEVYESYDRDIKKIANFSTEELAKKFRETHPNKNYMGHNKVKATYTIFESLEEAKEYSKEEIRKKALAKLSPQEREALGV